MDESVSARPSRVKRFMKIASPVILVVLAGSAAVGCAPVSHGCLRRSWPDWPHTVFTMVHAPTGEQCAGVLAELAEKTGVREYAALYSSKEYKKGGCGILRRRRGMGEEARLKLN
jgi:hypothetical protein